MCFPLALLPGLLLSALLLSALLLGCAIAPEPQPLPPQTVTATASQPPVALTTPLPEVPEVAPPPKPVEEPEHSSRDNGSLVILHADRSAPGETTNRDLVAAARLERERRKTVRPIAVVNDENLAEQASGGRLTIGSPRAVTKEELDEARRTLDASGDEEEYWRARAHDIRQRWRNAYDSLEGLEEQASALRRRFYAEEDLALRDRDIKPSWDESKTLLKEARETIEHAQNELDALYEDGRRAGALAGWLRAGIELEPWPEENAPEEDSDQSGESNPPRWVN